MKNVATITGTVNLVILINDSMSASLKYAITENKVNKVEINKTKPASVIKKSVTNFMEWY